MTQLDTCDGGEDQQHCKDKMTKIWNKYFQKMNIGVSVPISTFMCLWGNYIFPWWVCLFCWRKYVDRSWEDINCSQTHEYGNWGWGRAIPRKGIYKRNCRCSEWVASIGIQALENRASTLKVHKYTNWLDQNSIIPYFRLFETSFPNFFIKNQVLGKEKCSLLTIPSLL